MPVLVNTSNQNFEDVPDADAAIKAGTHGYPLYSPDNKAVFASDAGHAQALMGQGYRQPNPEELKAGLLRARVSTVPEKIGSLLEGGGEGASTVYTGLPVSTAAEAGLGALSGDEHGELSPEMIAARHKYNPGWEMAGNVGGVGLASYFGGEAGALNKLGEMGVQGLGKAMGREITQTGSIMAKNMIMSGVMSGDQELGKFMYDPSQTAEKAVANVGLNVAAGGVMGAALGSVPALWNKTKEAGAIGKYLQGFKESMDTLPRGGDINDTLATAGMSLPPGTQQILSSNPIARGLSTSNAVKDIVDNGSQEALRSVGIQPENLAALQEAGDSEVAAPIRQGVVKHLTDLHNTESQAWDVIRPTLNEAQLAQEAKTTLTDRVAQVQAPFTSTKNMSEEWGIAQKAIDSVPEQKTMADFKNWRSAFLQKLWGNPSNYEPAYPRMYWQMHHALDAYEGDLQQSSLAAAAPDLIPALQSAREASTNTKGFIQELNKTLKFGQTNSAQEAIDRISDPLKFTDNMLVQRSIPPDNDAWLQWAQQNLPDAVEPIKNAYRQRLVQGSLKAGDFDVTKMLANMDNKMSPSAKQFIMTGADGSDSTAKLGAIRDVLDAAKANTGGLSQAIVDKMIKASAGGMGATIGGIVGGPHGAAIGYAMGKLSDMAGGQAMDAIKMSLLKHMETGVVNPGAFKAMADFFDNAVQAHATMTAGLNAVVNGTLSPALEKKLTPNPKGVKQLAGLVDQYTANPEKMLGMGGDLATYLPDHHLQAAAVLGRAQQYLSQIKPQTDALGPLDSTRTVSQADQSKYNRALGLANNPMSILTHIHKGNLTTDDMAVMEGVYPTLHKEIQQKLMDGVVAKKQKGETVPYKQRLAISAYLGQNLDSTIGPMTMMTLMQGKQQGGQQPQPQRGGKKPPQGAFTKMTEGANANMTMAQKAEQDRVTPQ